MAKQQPQPKGPRFSLARAGDFKLKEDLEIGDKVRGVFTGTVKSEKFTIVDEAGHKQRRVVIILDADGCDVKVTFRPPKPQELFDAADEASASDDTPPDAKTPKPIPIKRPRRPKGSPGGKR